MHILLHRLLNDTLNWEIRSRRLIFSVNDEKQCTMCLPPLTFCSLLSIRVFCSSLRSWGMLDLPLYRWGNWADKFLIHSLTESDKTKSQNLTFCHLLSDIFESRAKFLKLLPLGNMKKKVDSQHQGNNLFKLCYTYTALLATEKYLLICQWRRWHTSTMKQAMD